MKRFQVLFILLISIFVIAACGKEENEKQTQQAPPLPISVDLQVPETPDVGQEVELAAKVTQGEEVVADASEVEFEIIEETSGKKQMIPAELKDDVYSIMTTFDQPGSYTVTSHVTARDMHTMPTKVVEVQGEATTAPQEHSEGHSHHHGAVIDFEDGTAVAGEETILSTAITFEDEPLTEAAVRFEIWKDGSEQHDWVDTTEITDGQYSARYTFKANSKYFVQVHVEKDPDLHDHVTKEYIVE